MQYFLDGRRNNIAYIGNSLVILNIKCSVKLDGHLHGIYIMHSLKLENGFF